MCLDVKTQNYHISGRAADCIQNGKKYMLFLRTNANANRENDNFSEISSLNKFSKILSRILSHKELCKIAAKTTACMEENIEPDMQTVRTCVDRMYIIKKC